MIDVLYVGSDNILEVAGLASAAGGAYVNDAVVSAVLKDSAGAAVAGQTFPITLSYQNDGAGTYRGTLEDTLALSENSWYTAEIIAIGGGATMSRRHRMMAMRRT